MIDAFVRGGRSKGRGEDTPPARKPIAVLTANWHLSHAPPHHVSNYVNRDVDWYATQADYLHQIIELSRKLTTPKAIEFLLEQTQNVPIVIAGNVFDGYNPPIELINFALRKLSRSCPIYSVPGEYDVSSNGVESLLNTAYGTLMLTGRILDIGQDGALPLEGRRVRLWGFPARSKGTPCPDPHDLYTEVAVTAEHLWTAKTESPDAPPENKISRCHTRYRGYDVVVCGGNPRPFVTRKEGILFVSPGRLDREHSVVILYDDVTVETHYLKVD